MRRRERVAKYSLSVTDEEWKRIKARASRASMTVSAYLVESALAVDPGRPAITLALTHDDQQVLLMLVESIHALLYENRGKIRRSGTKSTTAPRSSPVRR